MNRKEKIVKNNNQKKFNKHRFFGGKKFMYRIFCKKYPKIYV
jgi:hypothetical protein